MLGYSRWQTDLTKEIRRSRPACAGSQQEKTNMNMLTIFATALFLTVCLLVYLLRREIYMHKSAQAYIVHLSAENEVRYRHCIAVQEVVEKCAGGVVKRINEQSEIVDAIKSKAPDLFDAEPGLKHWLSANDQFYKALRDASTP